MYCWHHNNLILSFPTFALTIQPHNIHVEHKMSKMNMYTPCSSYYMASLCTPKSITMMHVFCLLKLNICFSLKVNKKLNNVYIPLVQQVDMLYRTVVFVDKTIQP